MTALFVNGVSLIADPSGLLWWPDERTAVVSDLHLEKGSSLAVRGRLIPPYDTASTLDCLERAIARLQPKRVICLGDSVHDSGAVARVPPAQRQRIVRLVQGVDWVWVIGNHDPDPPRLWGGRVSKDEVLGPLTFRHMATPSPSGGAAGEVTGHYHPVAAVRTRARRVRARCFVCDGRRLILPAFGAYTGGLDVMAPAIRTLFADGFDVHLLGRDRVYRLPAGRLCRDGAEVSA